MDISNDKNENIIKMPDLDYTPDSRGVGYVFFKSMLDNLDKTAQIDGVTGEHDDYAALLNRCIRVAVAMRSHQVTPNDIISICSTNHLNSCVPFISTFFLGGTIASFDPTLSHFDTTHLLTLVRPKLIFVSQEAIELIESAIKAGGVKTKIIVFGHTTKYTPFATFLNETEAELDFKPYEVPDLQKDAIIVFSSGTTGLPKGMRLSHYSVLGQMATLGHKRGDCKHILSFASLYWITAILFCGVSIIKGTTRIIVPKFDVDIAWEVIAKRKVTIVFASPYQMMCMYKVRCSAHLDVSSLQTMLVGGSPLPKEQLLGMRNMLPTACICQTYGMSETGFAFGLEKGSDADVQFQNTKLDSCGTGVLGMSFKIVNPDTEEVLGPNRNGELRLKSKYMLSGYYKMDSSNIWDSDGWLKTGDIAYFDDDKYVFVVDRLKEMLKFQSFHVLPASIENVLLTHSDVKFAVVVGVPHDLDGDHPMAVVVLNETGGGITEEELIKYVEDKVHDRDRLRGGVRFVKELPITPSGKFDRRAVKEMSLHKFSLQ